MANIACQIDKILLKDYNFSVLGFYLWPHFQFLQAFDGIGYMVLQL
jgi:hypothetical protein